MDSSQSQQKAKQFNWRHYQDIASNGLFSNFRRDFIAASGEFIGTTCFLIMGLGGVQAAATSTLGNLQGATASSVPNTSQLMHISISMGLSLLFSAWIFYRATGAAFNPNVSFALLLIGGITPTRFVLYVFAQLLASIVASALLQALIPGGLTVTPSLAPGVTHAQGLFIETFTTAALILAVLFMAVEKHKATHVAPVGIGITLFACHMFAVVYTGAAMNSARAFGPSVISGFAKDHWVYWAGPTLGSVLATTIYTFFKRFEYWTLNEGQDSDDFNSSPQLFVSGVMPVVGSSVVEKDKDGRPTEEGHPSVLNYSDRV